VATWRREGEVAWWLSGSAWSWAFISLWYKPLVHLNQSCLRWLYTGGIREEHAPGIAAFRQGRNGERYGLVAEYWKW
jgi:hypothetical protein